MYHNNISKLDQCRQNGKYLFFLVFDKNLTVSTLETSWDTLLEQILPHYGVKKWHITLHWSTFTQCTGMNPKPIARMKQAMK